MALTPFLKCMLSWFLEMMTTNVLLLTPHELVKKRLEGEMTELNPILGSILGYTTTKPKRDAMKNQVLKLSSQDHKVCDEKSLPILPTLYDLVVIYGAHYLSSNEWRSIADYFRDARVLFIGAASPDSFVPCNDYNKRPECEASHLIKPLEKLILEDGKDLAGIFRSIAYVIAEKLKTRSTELKELPGICAIVFVQNIEHQNPFLWIYNQVVKSMGSSSLYEGGTKITSKNPTNILVCIASYLSKLMNQNVQSKLNINIIAFAGYFDSRVFVSEAMGPVSRNSFVSVPSTVISHSQFQAKKMFEMFELLPAEGERSVFV